MDNQRFRKFLETLNISLKGFAGIVNYSPNTVRDWTRGRTVIPPDISEWVEKALTFLEKNPLPVKKTRQD